MAPRDCSLFFFASLLCSILTSSLGPCQHFYPEIRVFVDNWELRFLSDSFKRLLLQKKKTQTVGPAPSLKMTSSESSSRSILIKRPHLYGIHQVVRLKN